MASVGSAYVTIRVNTKGFEAQLNKTMSKLHRQMEKHGRDMGVSFNRGLSSVNPGLFFTRFENAAETASKNAAKSLDRVGTAFERQGQRAIDTTDVMRDSLSDVGDTATQTAADVRQLGPAFTEARNAATDLDSAVKGIGKGGGGGGGPRQLAGDFGFFGQQLNQIAVMVPSASAMLNRLYTTAAFGGTAIAGLAGAASAAAQGIFVVGAQALATAPALAVLSNAGLGLVQVFSAISIGSQGVGEAIGAGFESAKLGATQVAGANDAILRSTQAAARGVRDAKQALQDAYYDAARAAADAARRVQQAEAGVVAAQREVRAAQLALNAARKEGLEQLEDIAFAAEDAALGEERAALNLEEAYAALQAASSLPPDDRGRREAELAYKEAELAMRMAKDRRQDADKEQKQAAKNGVKGTDAMQDAYARLQSSQQALMDSQRALNDARREEAEVAVDNARKIQDAQQNLADAQDRLTDAQGRQNTSLNEAGTALDKYKKAMKELSPSQREFVKALVKMRPELMKARREIGQPMFTGLLSALNTMRNGGFFQIVVDGLADTGREIGNIAAQSAKTANEPVFGSRFSSNMQTNNKALKIAGGTLDNLLRLFNNIAFAARPLVIEFTKWTRTITGNALASRNSARDIELMSNRFQAAARRGKELFGFIRALWRVTKTLGSAALIAADGWGEVNKETGLAKGYIPSLTESLEKFDKKLNKPRNFKNMIKGFDQALTNMNSIGSAVNNAIIQPLVGMGQDPRIAEAFDKISGTGSFDKLADTALDALPALSDLTVKILDLAAALSESGSITVFLETLNTIGDVVSEVLGWMDKFVSILTFGQVDGAALLPVAGAILGVWKALKLVKKLGYGLVAGTIGDPRDIRKNAGKMRDAFRKANPLGMGKQFGSSIQAGITTGMGGTAPQRNTTKMTTRIRTTLSAQAKTLRTAAGRAGAGVAMGLALGISRNSAVSTTAATKAGTSVVRGVNRGAGVRSPSRLTILTGKQIMMGLTLGMRAGTAPAVAAGARAGRAAGASVGRGATAGVAGSMGGVTKAMGPMSKASKGLSFAMRGVGGAFRFALGPLMTIMLVIELLWPLFQKLYKENETFKKIVDTVWGAMKDAISAVGDAFKAVGEAIVAVVGGIVGFVKKHWKKLLPILLGPIGIAIALIIKHFDKIKKVVGIVVTWVKKKWKEFQNNLAVLRNFVGVVVDVIKRKWDEFKDKIGSAIDWVRDKFGDFKDKLREVRDDVADKIKAIKDRFSSIKDAVGSAFSNLGSKAKDGINSFIEFLNKNLIDKVNVVTSKFGLTIDHIPMLAEGGTPGDYLAGRRVKGPGGTKGDRIPTMLSHDEFVMKAKSARRIGYSELAYMNRHGTLPPIGGFGFGDAADWVGGVAGGAVDFGKKTLSGIGNIGKAIAKQGLGKVLEKIIDGVQKLMSGAGIKKGTFLTDLFYGIMDKLAEQAKAWGGSTGKDGAPKGGRDGGLATYASRSKAYGDQGGTWTYPLAKKYAAYNYAGHNPSWAVDIAAPMGTGVRAASSGVVRGSYNKGRSGYGRYMVVDHPGGISTLYAHLSSVIATAGKVVQAGERIARSGKSGSVSGGQGGAHLHFETLPGKDAIEFLKKMGVKLATGGVVSATNGGVLSVIAEAGRNERVEPLDSDGLSKRDKYMLELIRSLIENGSGGDQWNIHPAPGMNEMEFAKQVRREVVFHRRRGA